MELVKNLKQSNILNNANSYYKQFRKGAFLKRDNIY